MHPRLWLKIINLEILNSVMCKPIQYFDSAQSKSLPTQAQMISPDGNISIDAHPSKVESFMNMGWKEEAAQTIKSSSKDILLLIT